MSTVREDLIAAKALIAKPGYWAKGGGDGKTTFCAATTLNSMANASNCWVALWSALPEEEQQAHRWGIVGDIFRYNDHPDTTHADIMALFQRAIAAQDGV